MNPVCHYEDFQKLFISSINDMELSKNYECVSSFHLTKYFCFHFHRYQNKHVFLHGPGSSSTGGLCLQCLEGYHQHGTEKNAFSVFP